jgi:carboxyl-terminal processing protease
VTGESTQHRGVDPDIALPSHINAEVVGESARDSALPWDTVQTTRFRSGVPLTATIESLTAAHAERAEADPNIQYQLDVIEATRKMTEQKSLSLNKEVRKAEREAELQRRLDRENERRVALDLEPLASLDDLEEDEFPDIFLEQATGIVKDLATMREIASSPPQAAQVQP